MISDRFSLLNKVFVLPPNLLSEGYGHCEEVDTVTRVQKPWTRLFAYPIALISLGNV